MLLSCAVVAQCGPKERRQEALDAHNRLSINLSNVCCCRVQVLPEAPHDLVCELSKRYVYLYERITGEQFVIPSATEPVNERIQKAITTALKL